MLSSFTQSTTLTCNLCAAEGKSFVQVGQGDEESWRIIEQHTREAHPEHVAFLASGGVYTPVIPSPMGGD